jgi:hypothetical protein
MIRSSLSSAFLIALTITLSRLTSTKASVCGSGPSWYVSASATGRQFSSAALRTVCASTQVPSCGSMA